MSLATLNRDQLIALYLRCQFLITAFFGAKGGIGKSLLALATAIQRALEGGVVVLFDFDGNPGLTKLFLLLETNPTKRAQLEDLLVSNPSHTTVSRYLIQPERGLADLLLTLPLNDIVANLPRTVAAAKQFAHDEYDETWPVNPDTIVADTMAFYHATPQTVQTGQIYLAPNGGAFDDVIAEVARRKEGNTSYNPNMMLLLGLATLQEEFTARRLGTITDVIIDTAGELGLIPDVVSFVAGKVVLPFKKSVLSVDGLCNTVDHIQQVNRTRPDGHKVKILPPVGNFWRGKRAFGVEKMREVGLTQSDIHVPADSAIGDVPDNLGIIPFACHPLSDGMRAINAYRLRHIHAA